MFHSRYSAVNKLGGQAAAADPPALNPGAEDADAEEEAPLFDVTQFDGMTIPEKVDIALGLIQNEDLTIVEACEAIGITKSAFQW